MNKEAAHPACLHAKKLGMNSSEQEHQISPPHRQPAPADSVAARTNAGQAGETAVALRSAQREHENTERHPLTQGAAADSTVYHPAADICRVNSPSARTHPKTKTRFALKKDIYSSAAPDGGAAREALTSVLSKIGSPLPLPEQPKTPAHERANIRGWAFFIAFHRDRYICVKSIQKHSSTPIISFHIYPSRTPESL